MRLSPDEIIFWQEGFIKLNATIVFTWALMLVLVMSSALVTRNLSVGKKGGSTAKAGPLNEADLISPAIKPRSRWQNLLEIIVVSLQKQIQDVGLEQPRLYLGFLATLFLFIAGASISTIIPGYEPPTGSLSTTTALALCVLIAVPLFGIINQGLGSYLISYLQPTFLMLPFNIIGELSRTLALAVRLFGNMMSGSLILAILLAITPFIFPVVMTLLGLLTGMVQAYIFFILAAVYIAAATRTRKPVVRAVTSQSTIK